jgi:hypothetical protein
MRSRAFQKSSSNINGNGAYPEKLLLGGLALDAGLVVGAVLRGHELAILVLVAFRGHWRLLVTRRHCGTNAFTHQRRS